ncbi:MAG TPA: DUF3108 domain-containing protein [Pyrinomonadaceae bacterium]|nr:DUF3108 domain-containing protein [Pyrinomonadaceae bacterium]
MHRRHRLLQAALTFLFAAVLLPASAFAQQTPSVSAATAPGGFSPAPYRAGEKLTYNVSFSNFSSAGHVELFNAGRSRFFNREGFELRARVQSVGVVRAALYSIDNEYTSYVDPQTGLPFRTRFQRLEGGAATQTSTGIVQPAPAVEATPTTYDFLSALYRLRALPLAVGASYPVRAEGDGMQYDAELRVVGRETVKTAAGTFNAIVTQLRVRNNPDVNDYRPRIYFSDDERHVPVLLTARLKTGEIRAELASSELLNVTTTLPGGNVAENTPPPDATPTPSRVVVPGPARGDGAPAAGGAEADTSSDLPFKVGEQLNFNFFLGTSPQPVGVATYHVRARSRYAGRDGLWFSATMATTNALQQIFPVADKIETYVDAKTLLPFRSQLQIREGTHRLQGVVSLDQERGSATVTDGSTIEIPVGTYDLVSVIYALRSFDLTPPKRNAVSLLINKRPRTLFITSVKRETIELGGKRIPTFQLALATDEAHGERLQLRLWVGADRRRLPLRLTATTPLGPVRADLSIIPLAAQ